MATNNDLSADIESLITKLNTDITELQKEAMRLSAMGQFEECRINLKREQEAIGALIATTEAAEQAKSF